MPNYMGIIPHSNVRDFQRKRVYDAEELCSFWNTLQVLSLKEVKELVRLISAKFVIQAPDLITEGHHDDLFTAYATPTEIALPFPISKSVPFICHEMAHVVNYQLGPVDHHGPNFSSVYLKIVEKFIGNEAFTELKKAFVKTNVHYDPKQAFI